MESEMAPTGDKTENVPYKKNQGFRQDKGEGCESPNQNPSTGTSFGGGLLVRSNVIFYPDCVTKHINLTSPPGVLS